MYTVEFMFIVQIAMYRYDAYVKIVYDNFEDMMMMMMMTRVATGFCHSEFTPVRTNSRQGNKQCYNC